MIVTVTVNVPELVTSVQLTSCVTAGVGQLPGRPVQSKLYPPAPPLALDENVTFWPTSIELGEAKAPTEITPCTVNERTGLVLLDPSTSWTVTEMPKVPEVWGRQVRLEEFWLEQPLGREFQV